MGRAPAVLGARAVAALAALLAALVAFYIWRIHLPDVSLWWDVGFLGVILIPAVFLLVLIVLPARRGTGLLFVGVAFALLAFACDRAGLDIAANFCKLATTTAIGFWFLGYFETVAWVVLVALIIPWVDAYSVWRGPTKTIVAHHEHVFTVLSFAFPVPGEHAAANLGVPDLLFFALFLSAAARFGLRVYATWVCLVAALGATIALTVWLNLSGLPALPAIALGFLIPNADLIWRRLRGRPGPGDRAPAAV